MTHLTEGNTEMLRNPTTLPLQLAPLRWNMCPGTHPMVFHTIIGICCQAASKNWLSCPELPRKC